jgi:hypothetical protein
MPSTSLEGLSNVCTRSDYAFMTAYSNALLFQRNVTCSIMTLKESCLPETIAFAFRKKSPYVGIINFK